MTRYAYRKTYSWTPDLAYVVGLIASDGSLSKDGRHISFTSKDEQLALLYRNIIRPAAKLARKSSGSNRKKLYYLVQFSDTSFYDFLICVGLTPNKSLTMPALDIPKQYFADFLRGEFDGDGCIYGYQDTRWRSSFMYYTSFTTASLDFGLWLQQTISTLIPAIGSGSLRKCGRAYQLSYAKQDSLLLYKYMYYTTTLPCLNRKHVRYLELFAVNTYDIKE